MTTAAPRRPAFIPSLIYRDNRAALNWLQSAFGFEASEVLTDANGNIVHAEMSHGDGVIMIGHEFAEWTSIANGRDRQAQKSPWSPPISSMCRSYIYGRRSRRPSLDFRTVNQAPLQGGRRKQAASSFKFKKLT